jgi:hypothetical protein
MDQQDRSRALQPPRRPVESAKGLHCPSEETGLAVEKQEGYDPDQRRQHRGQRKDRGERPPTREVVAGDQHGEREADEGGERHARHCDPEASPQRAPVGGTADELADVVESPTPGVVHRVDQHQHERIRDQPDDDRE